MPQCFRGAMVSQVDAGGDAFISPTLLLLLCQLALNLVFFSKSLFLHHIGYDREVQASASLCPNLTLGCIPLMGLPFEIPI